MRPAHCSFLSDIIKKGIQAPVQFGKRLGTSGSSD